MSSKDKGIAIGLLHHVLHHPNIVEVQQCKAARLTGSPGDTFAHKIVFPKLHKLVLLVLGATGQTNLCDKDDPSHDGQRLEQSLLRFVLSHCEGITLFGRYIMHFFNIPWVNPKQWLKQCLSLSDFSPRYSGSSLLRR